MTVPVNSAASVSAQVPNKIPKTGRAVHAALDGENRSRFEVEFRDALAAAGEDFDLQRVTEVVERWWPHAVATANPDPIAAYIKERLDAGDDSVITKSADELLAEMRTRAVA